MYHQHPVVKSPLAAVQRCELFTVFSCIYDYLAACYAVYIKCMKRLAVFQHNIIRNIYNVVDRSHTCVYKPFLKPPRRVFHFYIFYDSGDISLAKVGFYLNAYIIRSLFCLFLALIFRVSYFFFKSSCRFSGHTHHGEAIRPVWGDFKVHYIVFQLESFSEVHTYWIFAV